VVEAKADGGSFEDKYIARFWHKLHVSLRDNSGTFIWKRKLLLKCIYPFQLKSYAGKVAGELDLRLPEDLRVLYMVPFSTEEASKDIEAVKVMAECCHNWIQSVEKVLLCLIFLNVDHSECFSLFHFYDVLMSVFSFFKIPMKLISRQAHTWSLITTPFNTTSVLGPPIS